MNTLIAVLLVSSLALFAFSAWRKERQSSQGRISHRQVAGFFLWQAIDRWLNYLLYPAMIAIFGLVDGTLVMIVVTLFSNTLYIVINNATEDDWTFMSWFTFLRDSQSKLWPLRYCRLLKLKKFRKLRRPLIKLLALVRFLLRLKIGKFAVANLLACLYMSIWKDSFCVVNFLYHKKADLRKIKVLSVYLASHIVCNVAWAPIAGLIAMGVRLILNLLPI